MPRKPSVRWHGPANAWRADVGPHGASGRRTPVYFREIANTPKGRRQAEEALETYLRERDRAEAAREETRDNPRVWQVVEAYCEHAEKTVESRTAATHAERLGVWMRMAPGVEYDADGLPMDVRRARDLGPADLSRVVRAMTRDGFSPHYVGGIARSVKACWAWAARYDEDRTPPRLVPEDVFRDVRPPKIPRAPERYVSPAQAGALLDWIDRKYADAPGIAGRLDRRTALLFRCLYESGARPGELCRATWGDFHAEGGTITLERHKTRGKSGRPRRVPLTAELVAALEDARSDPDRHPEFIFTHRRGRGSGRRGALEAAHGEPWTVGALGQKFRKLRAEAEAAGLDVHVRDGSGRVPEEDPGMTLYDFRRSWATDADLAGLIDQQIAAALGHSPEMTERVYRSSQASAVVRMAEGVAAWRRKAGGEMEGSGEGETGS